MKMASKRLKAQANAIDEANRALALIRLGSVMQGYITATQSGHDLMKMIAAVEKATQTPITAMSTRQLEETTEKFRQGILKALPSDN